MTTPLSSEQVEQIKDYEANFTFDELALIAVSLNAKLERFKTMSTVEMMCENVNVDAHIREWEARCLKAEARIKELTP